MYIIMPPRTISIKKIHITEQEIRDIFKIYVRTIFPQLNFPFFCLMEICQAFQLLSLGRQETEISAVETPKYV